ncbi:MAG: single-stranded DNA-binding protein [Planctomycetaceae bacterium]|nr:single-stranded DNA-binding protein [Planctomycetaceae bacterium]
MASYNKVILVGNLTRDPQMSFTPAQTPVCEIGLAVNRKWRTPDGQQKEETCFIDCSCFGRSAETLNKYMRKGQPILIEGRLHYSSWEGKDGTKRSKHRVVVERFQFLGGGQRGEGAPSAAGAGGGSDEPPMPDYDSEAPAPSGGGEDIPF